MVGAPMFYLVGLGLDVKNRVRPININSAISGLDI
jgi:hypoxanthine-guanine phosphoribosyltransferase